MGIDKVGRSLGEQCPHHHLCSAPYPMDSSLHGQVSGAPEHLDELPRLLLLKTLQRATSSLKTPLTEPHRPLPFQLVTHAHPAQTLDTISPFIAYSVPVILSVLTLWLPGLLSLPGTEGVSSGLRTHSPLLFLPGVPFLQVITVPCPSYHCCLNNEVRNAFSDHSVPP